MIRKGNFTEASIAFANMPLISKLRMGQKGDVGRYILKLLSLFRIKRLLEFL